MVYTTLQYAPPSHENAEEKEAVPAPLFSFDFEWDPPYCRIKARKKNENNEDKSHIEILKETFRKKGIVFETYFPPETGQKPNWFHDYFYVSFFEMFENLREETISSVFGMFLVMFLGYSFGLVLWLMPLIMLGVTGLIGNSIGIGLTLLLTIAPPAFLGNFLPFLIGTVRYFFARHRWNQQKALYDAQQSAETISVKIEKIEDLDKLLADIISNEQKKDVLKKCFFNSEELSKKIEYLHYCLPKEQYKEAIGEYKKSIKQALQNNQTDLLNKIMAALEKNADETQDVDQKNELIGLLLDCLDGMNNEAFLSQQKTFTAYDLFMKRGDIIFKYGFANTAQCWIALGAYQKAMKSINPRFLNAEVKDQLMEEVYQKQYAIYDHFFSEKPLPVTAEQLNLNLERKEEGSLDDESSWGSGTSITALDMNNINVQLEQAKQFRDLLDKLIGFEKSMVDVYQDEKERRTVAEENIKFYDARKNNIDKMIEGLEEGLQQDQKNEEKPKELEREGHSVVQKEEYSKPYFNKNKKRQSSDSKEKLNNLNASKKKK